MKTHVKPKIYSKNGGGVILNNASDWGLVGGRDAVAYCASKVWQPYTKFCSNNDTANQGAVILMTKAMVGSSSHRTS